MMNTVAVRLRLSVIGIFLCLFINQNPQLSLISINVAEAFLFQRLRSLPSTYSSFYHHDTTNATLTASNYNENKPLQQHQSQQASSYSNRAQQDPFSIQARSSPARESDAEPEEKNINGCPSECFCDKVAQIADCSKRNLDRVPSGFPKDIKRIRLERNNISELGPNAFHGLKRLQRIDLSNNNLVKIDPLAFSGLQSLNSLILYSNKLSQLPVNLFRELNQLQLLLLNANSLECINKDLFQALSNLNLLSLYDNKIETLPAGTFEGLKSIKTIHLGKNPLVCDCNLRWLADFLDSSPIETSEARCEGGPTRNQGKKLSQVNKNRFTCAEGNYLEQNNNRANQDQCGLSSANVKLPAQSTPQQPPPLLATQQDQSCPSGCICDGSTVDCSRISSSGTNSEESRHVNQGVVAAPASPEPASSLAANLEIPEVPDDIPVYVTRIRINDNRIKRIRETGLFRRLANSQKLDLGNNRIVDIEDNAINGAPKPERVIFVLLENEHCSPIPAKQQQQQQESGKSSGSVQQQPPEDQCFSAPKVNPPNFDSPCYNGGSCISGLNLQLGGRQRAVAANYSCLCPPGFTGPLCEINIDDCIEHQCQNGAMCVDGVNSYKCVCRDPTTSGEYCEQLNSYTTSSANSIAPMALPMIASSVASSNNNALLSTDLQPAASTSTLTLANSKPITQQILTRSADQTPVQVESASTCKRITQRKHYYDGNGCHSVRLLKLGECAGLCISHSSATGCCLPAKIKRRRVRMQCSDGASYVKTVDLVKKCACSNDCSTPSFDSSLSINQQRHLANQFNATHEDHLLQITRLDAVD